MSDEPRYLLVDDQADFLHGEEGLTKWEMLQMLADELGYTLTTQARLP